MYALGKLQQRSARAYALIDFLVDESKLAEEKHARATQYKSNIEYSKNPTV
jgi:hypothetical protein